MSTLRNLGSFTQGVDERIAYQIVTTNWGGSPTSVSAVAKAWNPLTRQFSDVTSTVFPANSPTVSGDTITLSLLRALTEGVVYRVEVQFTSNGNLFECFFTVNGEL